MSKKKIVLKNSLSGLLSQGVTILFTFITRSLFIKYIGIELLGVNNTFASLLSTLSLAELGFQTAIIYSLYKPIYDGNEHEINDVMNVYKLVYRIIGLLFMILSVLMLPFLRYIINGININTEIFLFFILQATATTCTYFLAYKRALLYADQKDYIAKYVDLLFGIIFNVLQCLSLYFYKNYAIYLIIKIIHVYTSNYFINKYCVMKYPYLKNDKINSRKLNEIFHNVKNIIAGKIASYIYSSTDNILISVFVNTVSVGYITNYTTITKSMRSLTSSVLNPITPMIGRYLIGDESSEGRENIFLLYTHVRYLISVLVVVPLAILIDTFISIWIGKDMILPRVITFLLIMEFYIDLIHSATIDFINGAGLFKINKYIEAIGAIVNIITSLILVRFFGIAGVLCGTVISQLVFWIGRSYIVYFCCLNQTKSSYFRYWIRNLAYLLMIILGFYVCKFVFLNLKIEQDVLKFIIGGFLCEFVLIITVSGLSMKFKEQKTIISAIKQILM